LRAGRPHLPIGMIAARTGTGAILSPCCDCLRLPTAASVHVFAEQYDAYMEGASSSILVTTLVSAITVPAVLYVIDRGLLPYELLSW
jgi:hypothetical protein